jgi:hypothetical protein
VEVDSGRGDTVVVMVELPDMALKRLLPTQDMDTCRLSRIRLNSCQEAAGGTLTLEEQRVQ